MANPEFMVLSNVKMPFLSWHPRRMIVSYLSNSFDFRRNHIPGSCQWELLIMVRIPLNPPVVNC